MQTTTGTVVSVKRQWWLKVNTKAFRTSPLDGATFPHIIKVVYSVDGVEYVRRKWIGARRPVPFEGSTVQVSYEEGRPARAKIIC